MGEKINYYKDLTADYSRPGLVPQALRDQLIRNENWDEAGEAYAEEHDRYCGVLLTFESWITQMLLHTGPEADARRARALPLWREDRTRQPDIGLSGPDQLLDEAARRRLRSCLWASRTPRSRAWGRPISR